MCPDGGAYMIDQKAFHAEALPDQLFHIPGILQAVAVADKYLRILKALDLFSHTINQGGQGFLSSADLADRYEMAFIVHMENGLNVCLL